MDDFRTWLADLASYLQRLPADVPRILLGISWGGKLAAAFARERPDLVAAFGMLCPGCSPSTCRGCIERCSLALARAVGLGTAE